jgi:hypothetical protein
VSAVERVLGKGVSAGFSGTGHPRPLATLDGIK